MSSNTPLTAALPNGQAVVEPSKPAVIGVLTGEGIGPDVVAAALDVLEVISDKSGRDFDVRQGGVIGTEARRLNGKALTDQTIEFCESVFSEGGALFCGPGGARFVYELRDRFDLYCKFTPLAPTPALRDSGVLRPEVLDKVDIIAVRENIGGLYFGQWGRGLDRQGREHAFHNFEYRQDVVDRILGVALRTAAQRRGQLCMVIKREGTPAISELWIERLEELAQQQSVQTSVLDIDNAVYQLIADPRQFDVFVSPNMFGDVLADTGSVLLASRGMSYSGNFNDEGHASYQTGHGAAYDLTGKNTANPCGQIMALAMMLEESFAMREAAAVVRNAVAAVLAEGYRTADIAASASTVVGTRELGERIRDAVASSTATIPVVNKGADAARPAAG